MRAQSERETRAMGERIGYIGPGKMGPGLPELLLEDGREACGFDVDEGKAGE